MTNRTITQLDLFLHATVTAAPFFWWGRPHALSPTPPHGPVSELFCCMHCRSWAASCWR